MCFCRMLLNPDKPGIDQFFKSDAPQLFDLDILFMAPVDVLHRPSISFTNVNTNKARNLSEIINFLRKSKIMVVVTFVNDILGQ